MFALKLYGAICENMIESFSFFNKILIKKASNVFFYRTKKERQYKMRKIPTSCIMAHFAT
jgi:hypothetical protein